MRLTELWRPGQRPTLSFELFPAHTTKARGKLDDVIDRLTELRPTFASVTFGAGGGTRDGSRQLVESLRQQKRLEVLAYLAGFGLGGEDVSAILDAYRRLGVDNVLVIRGDPPPDAPPPSSTEFQHASDLLGFIRSRHPDLCLGAAGYPEGHKESPSLEDDLRFLKLKVDGGARFIITQYFYDNRFYFDFVARCRGAGIEVPIIPGVMPIFSVKMMENLASLCGATITPAVRAGLAALPADDKEALLELGIELAARQCRELLAAGVPGLHLYTMDRAESVVGIVGRLRGEGLL